MHRLDIFFLGKSAGKFRYCRKSSVLEAGKNRRGQLVNPVFAPEMDSGTGQDESATPGPGAGKTPHVW